MPSLREIRSKIKTVKSTVGRGPGLARGNLYRRNRWACNAQASAQRIIKVIGMSLFLAVAFSELGNAQCGQIVLKEGPFQSKEGDRLGAPIVFENEIESHDCFPVYKDDRLVSWIASYYRTEKREIVRHCIEARGEMVTKGNKAGYVGDYEEVSRDSAEKIKLKLPFWTFLARPSFCGNRVAYWGYESIDKNAGNGKLYAMIFDLDSRVAVKQETLGTIAIQTDDEGHFPPIQWDPTGSRVQFDSPVGLQSYTPGSAKHVFDIGK